MAWNVTVFWKIIRILAERSTVTECALDNTHCRFCDKRKHTYLGTGNSKWEENAFIKMNKQVLLIIYRCLKIKNFSHSALNSEVKSVQLKKSLVLKLLSYATNSTVYAFISL